MAVCTFFLRGACKFGSNCRNDHPQDGQRQAFGGGGFGNAAWNNPRNTNAAAGPKNTLFSTDSMKADLTLLGDRPSWPLSSYGAAKYEPNLLSGLDESLEELRLRASMAQKSGNPAEYVTYEANKFGAAQQVYANALNNLGEAYSQAAKLSNGSTNTTNAFVSASSFKNPTTTSAFGGTLTPSAFGTSTFGQSATGAFGTPAASNPLSAQPTQPASAFAQPQQPTSAFGQAQTTQPASAFGQLQTSQTTSAFGQPTQTSTFGQASQPSSFIKPASGAFANLGGTGSSSAFGGGGFSAFAGGASAFGAAAANSNPTTTTSAFGQSSFGAAAPAPTQPTSTFGAPAAPAFGTPSAFGALASKPTSVFGAPSGSAFGAQTNTAAASPFGSSGQAASPFVQTSAFGGASTLAPLEPQKMQSAFSSQPLSAFPMASPSPSMFEGASAAPSAPSSSSKAPGPPDFANAPSQYKPGLTPYDLNLPSDYQQRLPADALEAFKSQKFEWGKVPDWIPPLELR